MEETLILRSSSSIDIMEADSRNFRYRLILCWEYRNRTRCLVTSPDSTPRDLISFVIAKLVNLCMTFRTRRLSEEKLSICKVCPVGVLIGVNFYVIRMSIVFVFFVFLVVNYFLDFG